MKIEFKRNAKGQVIAYKDGKPIGKVDSMGDEAKKEPEDKKK